MNNNRWSVFLQYICLAFFREVLGFYSAHAEEYSLLTNMHSIIIYMYGIQFLCNEPI